MAPRFYPRQFYTFPPPRPPNAPPVTPVVVTRYISSQVFFQLFAGTFCIFILGVLAWRIGKIFRFFSRNNVSREGRSPYTRYARTWYGWVPQERHEANKGVFRKAYEKYKSCTTWKSTHTDYAWVWWDPGQKGLEAYYENRRPLRWLPKWLRSYEPTTADTIWNPGPPPPHAGLSQDNLPGGTPGLAVVPSRDDVSSTSDSLPGLSKMLSTNDRVRPKGVRTHFSSIVWTCGRGCVSDHHLAWRRNPWSQRPQMLLENARFLSIQNHADHAPRRDVLRAFSAIEPARWSASVRCLASTAVPQRTPVRRGDTSWGSELSANYRTAKAPVMRRCCRKYQVWSTWMQVQPSGLIEHRQRGIIGPPGTPKSEFLISLTSIRQIFSESLPTPSESHDSSPSDLSSHAPSSIGIPYLTARSTVTVDQPEELAGSWSATPFLCNQNRTSPLPPAGDALVRRYGFHSLCNLERFGSVMQMPRVPTPRKNKKQKTHGTAVLSRTSSPIPLDRLSDWEVRLIDNLDRKLDWLLQEVDPGRKPFHFPTLANHWLNKRTWKVLDPCSRTPIDDRRQHGDPRFNMPYPEQTYGPKRKYPVVSRRQAHSPEINSWRAAVNRQRKASGLRDFIRAVELFDASSADDPPDGRIDPACWILRKPPQGFAMSTKQQRAFYEGVGGWQETLSGWQKVRRGYRIRKAIHEGRVNRNRVKVLARGFARRYRTTWSKGMAG